MFIDEPSISFLSLVQLIVIYSLIVVLEVIVITYIPRILSSNVMYEIYLLVYFRYKIIKYLLVSDSQ